MNPEGVSVEDLVANERFQNYCNNSNKVDVAFWQQWIKEHPEYQEIVVEAKSLVNFLSLEPSDKEIATEFRKFKQTISPNQQIKEPKIRAISSRSKNRPSYKIWMGVAASIILVLAITIWQMDLFNQSQSYEVITNFGEIQSHLLPDGSKVILNANSRITYKDWAANGSRRIQLNGEAFFEVQPKTERQKFIVETNKGNIEVLGTSFNVLQRADILEVSLLEGVVSLAIPNFPIINMTPGERVLIEGTNYESQEGDVDAFSAWRFQRMVFKEIPIKKVIQRLADEFDLNITVLNKAVSSRKISASIPKNDPTLLLDALSEIYDLQIEQKSEKEYVIR